MSLGHLQFERFLNVFFKLFVFRYNNVMIGMKTQSKWMYHVAFDSVIKSAKKLIFYIIIVMQGNPSTESSFSIN